MSTDLEYFKNPEQWGDYQFTSLDDIINDYIAGRDADDYTSTVPRYQILLQGKKGVRELYFDVVRRIKGIELELSPTLNITVPPDYVNYVRVSWVNDSGELVPMAVDSSIPIAQSYLQDHDYEILFDDEGEALSAGSTSDSYKYGSKKYSMCGFHPNLNTKNSFSNGRFSFDSSTGVIQFSSDIEGKSVVLEYISDGLYEDDIKVHKFTETALIDFIYYELIKNRRTVPANEKMRARKEYFNSRRIAKRRINTIRKEDLLQAMKGSTKWIKN